MALYEPVTKQMKIDLRMNLKTKKVELKTTKETEDEGALQKSADFVQAFLLGFEVQDAVALLRLDDLYLECFEVKDVKQTLKGEHMSDADAHSHRGPAHTHLGQLPEHQNRQGCPVQPHPGEPAGEGVLEAQEHHRQARRAILILVPVKITRQLSPE